MSRPLTIDLAADPVWDSLRDTIRTLYLDKNLTLEDIRCEMTNKYQFDKTKAQYELQFKRWNFRKNRTAEEWKIIAQKITKRKRQHKDSDVYVDGVLINPKKLRKETYRYGSTSATTEIILQMPSPQTPESFIVCTPSPRSATPAPRTTLPTAASPHFYVPTPLDTAPVILDCLPFCQLNSLLIQDENLLSSNPGSRISASVVVSQDVLSSVLNQFKEVKNGEMALGPSVQDVKALMPANIFASNLATMQLALSHGQESSAIEFLKLSLFLISNNFFGATAEVSRKIYEWIKRHSNIGLLEHLLAIGGPTIEALAENFFRLAIDSDDAHTVKKMIEWGIDPNEQVYFDKWGFRTSPLQRACEMRSLELVRALIDGGAVVNIPAQNGHKLSLLMCVLESDYFHGRRKYWIRGIKEMKKIEKYLDTRLVQILLNAGAAVNPGTGESPLSKAAEIGHVEAVALLISAGADVHFLNKKFHHPPLIDAVSCALEIPDEKVIRIVRSLLEAGADPNARADYPRNHFDTEIENVLGAAMPRKSVELIQLLLDNGARITESAFATAAGCCGWDITTLLLKSGARITELVIESAIKNSDSNLFWFLLNKAEEDVKMGCKSAALIKGIACGNMDLIESLDASGARLENTPGLVNAMEAAAKRGDVSVFRFLLGRNSRHRDTVNKSLGKPLLTAISNSQNGVTEILLGAGADVNATSHSQTVIPLLTAIRRKDLQLVQKLLAAGAAVNCNLGVLTFSVVPAAVAWGYDPLILDIINAGAEVNAPDPESGELALTIAIGRGDLRIVKLLIDAGADVNATPSRSGQTALEAACREKNVDMVRYLLGLGADPDEASLLAAVSVSVELVQILLTARLNRYQRFSQGYGCVALQRSILLKQAETIEILLAKGVNTNSIVHRKFDSCVAQDPNSVSRSGMQFVCYGESALGSAIKTDKSNDLWIVRRLLRGGADPNSIVIEDPFCQTALLAAVDQNNLALVSALIVAGAKPDPNDSTGYTVSRTPLQLAVEKGRSDIVDVLLKHGADVNAPPHDRYGATALQFAALGGYVPLAHLLLERGADVNALPAKVGGRTALEAAAEHGRIDMLKLLLNAGAHITGQGGEQYDRAREFASNNGHASARRLLETYYKTMENSVGWDEKSMDLEFFNSISLEIFH